MERASIASIRTARTLLAVVFAVNVYRAAMQSITPVEAFAFDRFVRPPLREVLARYDTYQDVLYMWLARVSLGLFHLSELSLRLPSLLCGGLYLWVVYRLARRWFGSSPWMPAAVALLTLNPLVGDYLSMARGVGMAMAFWLWSLELLLEIIDVKPLIQTWKLILAAIALGLSVAASLWFAAPAGMLAAIFAWRRSDLSRNLLIPAFVTAFVLVVLPLNHAGAQPPAGVAAKPAVDRTMEAAVFLIPLITLAALLGARGLKRKSLRVAAGGGAVLVILMYLMEFRLQTYGEWPEYIHARMVAKALRQDAGRRRIRIGAGPSVAPVINFYRARYGQFNWEYLEGKTLRAPYDYFVLTEQDQNVARQRGLRTIYQDGGLLLAR